MSRVLIALFSGLVFFLVYVVAAMTVADRITGLNWIVQLVYFAIAGSLWVFPVWGLMVWAARGRRERPG